MSTKNKTRDDEDRDMLASASTSSGIGSGSGSSRPEGELAWRETRRVKITKLVVILVLMLAAGSIATLIYKLTANQEEQNFEEDIVVFADEISEVAEAHTRSLLAAARGLSMDLTASVAKEAWPFATLPFWEARAQHARKVSGVTTIAFAPLVQNKSQWEDYAVANQQWIREGLDFLGLNNVDPGRIPTQIFSFDTDTTTSTSSISSSVEHALTHVHAPLWQLGAAPTNASNINLDILTESSLNRLIQQVVETKEPAISEVIDLEFLYEFSSYKSEGEEHEEGEEGESDRRRLGGFGGDEPHGCIVMPVFDSFDTDEQHVVGVILAEFPWSLIFKNDELIRGMHVELDDSCSNKQYAYFIDSKNVEYLGEGSLREDTGLHEMGTKTILELEEEEDDEEEEDEDRKRRSLFRRRLEEDEDEEEDKDVCGYSFYIHPSQELRDTYITNQAAIYAVIVVVIFIFTSLVFVLYDLLVQRRQVVVMTTATNANSIVSSLFPSNVQKRIMQDQEQKGQGTKSILTSFLDERETQSHNSKPIADFFPEATVMFGDISGFTAWSSAREPAQVFTLLEVIYQTFDGIAKKRRVFKIETVGDCYVAVAGLPEARADHAVVMARFASECGAAMGKLAKRLDLLLGPDTSDISMRFGLHSGPVTAGVLRDDKMRFQMFGDTPNTAAKMEATGLPGRIQVSRQTADLLIAADKEKWLKPRQSKIQANNKSDLQTFWLELGTGQDDTTPSFVGECENFSDLYSEVTELPPRITRLVDWSSNLLANLLGEVAARRTAVTKARGEKRESRPPQSYTPARTMPLEEVQEIITLPNFDARVEKVQAGLPEVALPDEVFAEIKDFMTKIALMYRRNPFHNFEHCCHVSMSVVKLLSRIVAPDYLAGGDSLHDHTYGITSDPLSKFACVFSALIHDVDHVGVSNAQLVKEKSSTAALYDNKSVAEQNSVDLAWKLLMNDRYSKLRGAIYANESELHRFRHLVVNSVMATDIMDKELKTLRNNRWDKAFIEKAQEEKAEDDVNRKATIVIEHLIQASDICHTMQHWHIYRKWNERLFTEMYFAYKTGRMETDPSTFWYKGELGFFDFYIIPLTKKLKECGVFGVSSFEYLNYALQNREEWEEKGEAVVAQYIQNVEKLWREEGVAILEGVSMTVDKMVEVGC